MTILKTVFFTYIGDIDDEWTYLFKKPEIFWELFIFDFLQLFHEGKMKKLMFFLMLVCLQTFCFSKPDFKKIESYNYNRYSLYDKIDFYGNQYFVKAGVVHEGSAILIFDPSFQLKDSIMNTQLLNYLKDDLNLNDWDYVVINDFAIDSLGNLLLATHKGVVVYNIAKKEFVKSYHYKNSVLPQTPISNIFIEKDTIVIYPNANEIYYLTDNELTKVEFPIDTTMGEWTKFNISNNAVLHQGKFYYLAGFSKNLIVYNGENFSLYDSGDYIVDKYQQHGHLLICNNGSVYFFEIKNRLNLIKFTDGEYSVTDFIKSGIFTIPDNCVLYNYNFKFDNTGNLWLGFQTNDTISSKIEKYLLRFNTVTDYSLYKIEDLISGYDDGAFRISIIPETNEILLCTNYSIYKTDLNTDVKETAENLPNLFLMDVFPNPAYDFITIQLSNKELQLFASEDKVQIFDVLGIEVMSESIHPMTGSHRMNVEKLPAGVYFIRIGNKVEKFVKM